MIGDSLETDIKGANKFGIDSLLILSGNTGKYLKENKMSLTKYLQESTEYNPRLNFFAHSLIW